MLSLFLILVFSLLPIFLRHFNLNYPWFDSFVRHLVFLCCFLGGALATGRGTNISIDILARYFQAREMKMAINWLGFLVSSASFLTVCWFINSGLEFSKMEFQYPTEEFLGIHSGYLASIIPFGFTIIAFRFLVQGIEYGARLLGEKGAE
jgi:TRAP-type C4-dicarboxylate transport system permease small subunit